VERADILRLEILYRHGGVYLDGDLECLRPIDPVLEGQDFVGVCHKPGRITNTAIAAVPQHPLLERALDQVNPMEMYWTAQSERLKEVAGPLLLEKLVPDYPEIKLLEPPFFFPSTPEEREDAIAVHHMARVWHNATTLRAAMLRAEKRLEKVKTKLADEERAHAATKKRLEKLQSRRKDRAGRGEGGEGAGDEPGAGAREGAGEETASEPRADKRERREKRAWMRRSG
jgi:mannosyltransferase OCH1-like enzyme